MATLTMKYTTQKKYDALSDEEKSLPGYIFYVKASSDYSNCNAYYSNNKCYGAVPIDGEVAGIQQIQNVADLPTIGRRNTIYAHFDDKDELTMYIWNENTLCYNKMEETYDVIDGGDANSKTYVTYNK